MINCNLLSLFKGEEVDRKRGYVTGVVRSERYYHERSMVVNKYWEMTKRVLVPYQIINSRL